MSLHCELFGANDPLAVMHNGLKLGSRALSGRTTGFTIVIPAPVLFGRRNHILLCIVAPGEHAKHLGKDFDKDKANDWQTTADDAGGHLRGCPEGDVELIPCRIQGIRKLNQRLQPQDTDNGNAIGVRSLRSDLNQSETYKVPTTNIRVTASFFHQ